MLFIIMALEVILAVIALKELGLRIALAAFGSILLLYFWVSTKDVKGSYLTLQRSEIPWLYDGIAEMAKKAGLPMPRVYILDDYIPNAYSFKNTIVLSLGLFEVLDSDEILAVAAHELGHIKNGDTKIFPVLAYGRFLMMVFTGVLILLAHTSAVTVAALFLYALYEVARANFLKSREFQADETALRLLDVPMSLKHALEELKYYEDLRVGVRLSALPSIEPAIERKQKPAIIETHPSYDERIFRILVEINGNNMFNQRVQ
ncbi:M48 family metallopeptidase [Thermococcus thioreducens]|uniref:Zinc metallopeptidase n=1 Tax=Thermococcus thioreducens TaxID=277988 RepID=A0A0Q2S1U4_9EURY|nr:M48 family metalloprotease [Thermococcus thioreducens]ASJ13189.1 zinc metallopeptidase [Thermococcus thioreducens]KQH81507.1 zinc metallopeptidase [Thermococcus thioreducens]SEW20723.1 Zn-dependent protease with chaperone function [Thermococcus thioreducens]